MYRRSLTGGLAAALALALAAPATAHVTVNPREAAKGGFAKLAFRVPNERDDSGTTRVAVQFPAEHPIAFVSVKPTPGWTFEVERGAPATPVSAHGEDVTEVVRTITWSGGPVKPGEFQEFEVSVGPLPEDVDQLVFPATQTYASGEVVRWIELPSGDEEPERPAPVLTLTAADGGHGSAAASGEETPDEGDDAAAEIEVEPVASVTESDVDGARTLGIVGLLLGAIALVVAVVGTLRRRTA